MKHSISLTLLLGVVLFCACTQTDYERDLKIAQNILEQDKEGRTLSTPVLGDMKIIHVYSKNLSQPIIGPAKFQFCDSHPQVSYLYKWYDNDGNTIQDSTKEAYPYTGCGTGRINIAGRRYPCEIGYLTKNNHLSPERRSTGISQLWLVVTIHKSHRSITFQGVADLGIRIDACCGEVANENIKVFSRLAFEFPSNVSKRTIASIIAEALNDRIGYISD